ncbi:uncharacterized protein [Typha latifolia]|uniref:uncharacterized protein isoform X2 n=1 Tax=Typha latifolia TaxID=4733 RepID=UPI003C2F8377
MWLGEARRRFQGGARRKHAKMIDDQDLGLFAGFLAIFIFTLAKKQWLRDCFSIYFADKGTGQYFEYSICGVVTGMAHMRLACNHVTRCWELAGSI